MKKIYLFLIILFCLGCFGCTNKALEFKEDYESLNGIETKSGKINRTISIPNDNPYEKITTKELINKINHKETFYVYFGDKLCPWCRSVIEKSIEVAKANKIKRIYYIPIWDDSGLEIVRDKYEIVDGELKKTINGTKDYYKLLEIFNDLLSDYSLTDENGNKIPVMEKRIYAPNFIYVEDGIPKKITTGVSDNQNDPRGELTDNILKDEEALFKEFFNN